MRDGINSPSTPVGAPANDASELPGASASIPAAPLAASSAPPVSPAPPVPAPPGLSTPAPTPGIAPDPDPSPEGMPGPGPQVFPSEENPDIYISNWTNFTKNFDSSALQSSVVSLGRSVRNTINQADTSTPVLNQAQTSALQNGRPGLNFPQNVRQATANALVKDYDSNALRQSILNHSQPTVGGEISGWLGSQVGSIVTDPIAAAAAAGATLLAPEVTIPAIVSSEIPETIGLEASAMRSALAERATTRFIQGGVGFGAFTATQEEAKSIDDETSGDTFNAYQAALNIGTSFAVGGFLHSVGGFISDTYKTQKALLENRKAFGDEASADAAQSSASSYAQGKDPQPEIPLRNGLAQNIKGLHEDMAKENVSQSDMLDALDEAKENISSAQDENENDIDDLNNAIGDSAPSDEQQAQIDSLHSDKVDLQMRSEAQEVYRHMVQSSEESLTKPQLDGFINNFQDPEEDYANGRGQQVLPEVGEPIENPGALLNDQYPPAYKSELLKNATFTPAEQDTFTNIKSRGDRTAALRAGIDRVVKCLSGGGE